MQDQKFEKDVQQKMEELSFPPSDAVWTKVDAAINTDRRRRKPVLWIFLFLGLSLAGSLYLMLAPAKRSISMSATKNEKPAVPGGKIEDAHPITSTPVTDPAVATLDDDKTTNIHDKTVIAGKTLAKTNAVSKQGYSNTSLSPYKNAISKNNTNQPAAGKQISTIKNGETNDNNTVMMDAGTTDHAQNKSTQNQDKTVATVTNTPPSKPVQPSVDAVKKNTAADDSAKIPAAAKKDIAINSHAPKWQIGFTAGGGISSDNTSLFKSGAINVVPNSNVSPSANPYYPSDVKPNMSFIAGFFLQKQLSKRVDFSIGAGYHYYSTSMLTGKNNPGLANNPVFAGQTYNYYSVGGTNKYINRYHFVELPVSLGFRLDKQNKWPVYWNAGIAFSYLVSTNGLHFDPFSGIYYSNINLFNKLQAGATSSLMIGIPTRGIVLQVGPQVQYNFTDLSKNSQGNKDHLFFAGIKLSALLGKK